VSGTGSGLSQRGSSRSQHQDADRRPGPDGTSERIRDKIGASKRKGFWVGVMVPLGYVSRDKKLLIVEGEAERVRTIFQRYLALADE
jgi:hypothetical protein